jgi:Ricin-type beta-trefoil lectin domain
MCEQAGGAAPRTLSLFYVEGRTEMRKFVLLSAVAGGAATLALMFSPLAANASTSAPASAAAPSVLRCQVGVPCYQRIVNFDGRCLDMTGRSTAKGVQPQQWTCNGGSNQEWAFNIPGRWDTLIKNKNSGLCLSILNNNLNPGSEVIQWTCDPNDSFENWITGGQGNFIEFYNDGNEQPGGRLCGDVFGDTSGARCAMHPNSDGTANGDRIYVNSYKGLPSYAWSLPDGS